MDSLPVELIAHIFKLGQAQVFHESGMRYASFAYPVLLCSICSLWRTVALETPTLWSIIHVQSGPVEGYDDAIALARLKTQLLRSESAPLLLAIHFHHFLWRADEAWALITHHLHRCRVLALFEVPDGLVYHRIFPLPSPCETLETLAIQAIWSVDSASVLDADAPDGYPKLSAMALCGFDLTRIPASATRLRKVCISGLDVEPHTLSRILSVLTDWSGAQTLEYLELRQVKPGGPLPPSPDSPNRVLVLPRLISLCIEDYPFLDHISAPSLKILEWKGLGRRTPPFSVTVPPGVETLALIDSYPRVPPEVGPLDALNRLVLRQSNFRLWLGLFAELTAGLGSSPKHAPNLQMLEVHDEREYAFDDRDFVMLCRFLDNRPGVSAKLDGGADGWRIFRPSESDTAKYGGRLTVL